MSRRIQRARVSSALVKGDVRSLRRALRRLRRAFRLSVARGEAPYQAHLGATNGVSISRGACDGRRHESASHKGVAPRCRGQRHRQRASSTLCAHNLRPGAPCAQRCAPRREAAAVRACVARCSLLRALCAVCFAKIRRSCPATSRRACATCLGARGAAQTRLYRRTARTKTAARRASPDSARALRVA